MHVRNVLRGGKSSKYSALSRREASLLIGVLMCSRMRVKLVLSSKLLGNAMTTMCRKEHSLRLLHMRCVLRGVTL